MAKYSPNDVVRIKREIQSLSIEVSGLSNERDIVKKELEHLNVTLNSAREKTKFLVGQLFKSYDEIVSSLNKEKLSLENSIVELQKELTELKQIQTRESACLRENILFAKEKERVALNSSEIATHNLNDILNQIESQREILNLVTSQKEEKEKSVFSLKENEKELLSRIAEINEQIEIDISEGKAMNKKLEVERERLRRQIEVGRNWERDIKAMEARLTPEYQEVYKRLPSRKNK